MTIDLKPYKKQIFKYIYTFWNDEEHNIKKSADSFLLNVGTYGFRNLFSISNNWFIFVL